MPAHDERDFEFAVKYGFGIEFVVLQNEFELAVNSLTLNISHNINGDRYFEPTPDSSLYLPNTQDGILWNS